MVPTIHSARLQAAVEVTPEGNAVASSSQWSASVTASATASFCFWLGDGSGFWATTLRAMSIAKSQLIGPSCGCIRDWIWLNRAPRSGEPLPPKNCSNGVPLKGFWPLIGRSAGVVAHAVTVRVVDKTRPRRDQDAGKPR